MKNLIIRSISGTVYVGLIIGSLFLHKFAFSALLLFFNVAALYEFAGFRIKELGEIIRLLFLSVLTFVLHHFVIVGSLSPDWLWVFALIPIGIATRILFAKKTEQDVEISYPLLGLLYITVPLMLLNQLNMEISEDVSWLIIIILILIWVNDSFAYLTGMAIGKHKLFERISPKKSWEGFFGGILATVVVAWFFHGKVGIDGIGEWIFLALLVALSSVIGDFVESMFKRSAGVKDSGKLIPGHGGVLDRIDSILFVFPVVFVYLQTVQ